MQSRKYASVIIYTKFGISKDCGKLRFWCKTKILRREHNYVKGALYDDSLPPVHVIILQRDWQRNDVKRLKAARAKWRHGINSFVDLAVRVSVEMHVKHIELALEFIFRQERQWLVIWIPANHKTTIIAIHVIDL